MERKIGEIFEYNGEWLQCLESPTCSCKHCDFYDNKHDLCYISPQKCLYRERSDKKDVIFKKLEKVGEPFLYKGKQMQSYIRATDELICNWNNNLLLLEHGDSDIIDIEIKQTKEDMEEKKLNLKPFNIQKAREGKPVCTRDGRKARIICFDLQSIEKTPIVAAVQVTDKQEVISNYYEDGRQFVDGISELDLMLEVPEEKPKCEFKPFDRVLVRDLDFNRWYNDIFSFRDKDGRYVCIGEKWDECIPYNEETAHLLGTTDNFEDNK